MTRPRGDLKPSQSDWSDALVKPLPIRHRTLLSISRCWYGAVVLIWSESLYPCPELQLGCSICQPRRSNHPAVAWGVCSYYLVNLRRESLCKHKRARGIKPSDIVLENVLLLFRTICWYPQPDRLFFSIEKAQSIQFVILQCFRSLYLLAWDAWVTRSSICSGWTVFSCCPARWWLLQWWVKQHSGVSKSTS